MERLFYSSFWLGNFHRNAAARLTHLTQATESCVLGADDDLVNANVTSVTEPDREVGIFSVVVKLGDTHDG
jgi:hypothetical protein